MEKQELTERLVRQLEEYKRKCLEKISTLNFIIDRLKTEGQMMSYAQLMQIKEIVEG